MITFESKTVYRGQFFTLQITHNETKMEGFQCDLYYDTSVMDWLGFTVLTAGLGDSNEISNGVVRIIVSDNKVLGATIGELSFQIWPDAPLGNSTINVLNLVAGDKNGALDVPVENSIVTVGVGIMQVKVAWEDPNSDTVTTRVMQGDELDPALGLWVNVGEVAPGVTELTFEVAVSQGILGFYVEIFNAVGSSGPSAVVSLNTDLPQPAQNVTITIV